MDWELLEDSPTAPELRSIAKSGDVIFFKHSTRCSVSAATKQRLERILPLLHFRSFLVDVINQRNLSAQLEEMTGVKHESPQVLIFRNGRCILSASHFDITEQTIQSVC